MSLSPPRSVSTSPPFIHTNMSYDNLLCSKCCAYTVKCVCVCEFPLPQLCSGDCIQKHKLIPGFHFEQPLEALSCITKSNFMAYRSWFFNLSGAQKTLLDNLAAFDELEKEVNSAFDRISEEIAMLKREYLTAVKALKSAIEAIIQSSIGETTAQATKNDPVFKEELSQWVWWNANPENSGNIQLYQMGLEIAENAEIRNLCCVNIVGCSSSLPQFPLNRKRISPIEDKKSDVERLSAEIENLQRSNKDLNDSIQQILLRNQDLETQLEEVKLKPLESKPQTHKKGLSETSQLPAGQTLEPSFDFAISAPHQSELFVSCEKTDTDSLSLGEGERAIAIRNRSKQCRTCGIRYEDYDNGYQCPNECQCKRCSIESLVAGTLQACSYCGMHFSENVVSLMLLNARKCHICGIALPPSSIASSSKCEACLRCMNISEKPTMALRYPSKGDSQVPLSGSQSDTRPELTPNQALSLSANPMMKSRSIQRAAPPELPLRSVKLIVPPDDNTSKEAKVCNIQGISVRPVAASHRLPTTPTPPQKHACKTCGMQFSSEDEHIRCENRCECTTCCTESIVKENRRNCKWCKAYFDSHTIDTIIAGMAQCHVCEIVVPREDIDENARCKACMRCVRLQKKVRKYWTDKIVGVCSLCKVDEFTVNETKYLKLQAEKVLWGCCSKGNSTDRRLPCKHFVCQAHQNVLRQCRACGYRFPSP